jgi:ferric-dicitrate binding protein FerR (iron transport regulator)
MLATLDGSKIQVFGGSDLAITRGLQGFELGLKRGAVEVRSPSDRGIAVVAEDVRARSHGQTPAAFLFDHRGEDIRVTTYRGAVEVSGPALRDGPTIVPAGQTAWLWLTTQGPQIQPQPPYPAGAGAERAKKRERRVLYLLLAGGAAAGTVAAIILATESDPRP